MEIDCNPGTRNPRLRKTVEFGIRVDRLDALHTRRVVRQVRASAEADFENAPLGGGERALARLAQHTVGHCRIEQVRKHAVMIKTHANPSERGGFVRRYTKPCKQ